MTTIIDIALLDRIAVGQQYRVSTTLCDHGRGKPGHHVGTIEIVGYLAETLGFTLCTEIPTGLVQPFERGVVLRPDQGFDFEFETLGHLVDDEFLIGHRVIRRRQFSTIKLHRAKLEMFTVECQRVVPRKTTVLSQCHCRQHVRGFLCQFEYQVNGINPVVWLRIVLQIDGFGC